MFNVYLADPIQDHCIWQCRILKGRYDKKQLASSAYCTCKRTTSITHEDNSMNTNILTMILWLRLPLSSIIKPIARPLVWYFLEARSTYERLLWKTTHNLLYPCGIIHNTVHQCHAIRSKEYFVKILWMITCYKPFGNEYSTHMHCIGGGNDMQQMHRSLIIYVLEILMKHRKETIDCLGFLKDHQSAVGWGMIEAVAQWHGECIQRSW